MKHLIFLHARIFRNRLLKLSLFDEIKIVLLSFLGLLFLAGIYAGAWRLLSYLNGVAIIGPLLVNKLLTLVFVTAFSMVVLSSLITSFSTIFFNKDVSWLMATPVPLRQLFSFKAFMTIAFSSWMVLVALAPFLAALGQVKAAAPAFWGVTCALLLPFLAIASLCGVMASMLLMRFLPSRRTRDLLMLLGVFAVTGLYLLFRFLQPERLVKPDGLEVVAQYLAYLNAPTAVYLPSWWITAGIMGALSGNWRETVFYGVVLYGTAVVVLLLTIALAEKFYFVGWAESQVYRRRIRTVRHRFHERGAVRALFEKDSVIFFRDANQWSQLLMLGALVVVYLFSIYKLPLETMYLQNLVSFFNVGLIGFILAALSLRFVFPLVSLEGENLWLLRSVPLSTARLLGEKLLFGSFPILALGLLLTIASNWLLKADWQIVGMSLAAIGSMSIGLSALALGFGALFPRFDVTNVAQIESSAGGIMYMVTALFYLGLNIALWAIPVQNFYQYKFGGSYIAWKQLWWIAAALATVNAFAAVVPLWLGWRNLEGVER